MWTSRDESLSVELPRCPFFSGPTLLSFPRRTYFSVKGKLLLVVLIFRVVTTRTNRHPNRTAYNNLGKVKKKVKDSTVTVSDSHTDSHVHTPFSQKIEDQKEDLRRTKNKRNVLFLHLERLYYLFVYLFSCTLR